MAAHNIDINLLPLSDSVATDGQPKMTGSLEGRQKGKVNGDKIRRDKNIMTNTSRSIVSDCNLNALPPPQNGPSNETI